MAKIDILTRPPKTDYLEPTAPPMDAGAFSQVVQARRSVRVFTEEKVSDEVIEKCLDLALLSPTSSNLQCWHFIRVQDEKTHQALAKICMNQIAARSCAEMIVCVARTNDWRNIQAQMLAEFTKLGDKVPRGAWDYYKRIVPIVYNQGPLGLFGLIKKVYFFISGFWQVIPREPTSQADMRVWAHKTCALASQTLMLALRAHELDTCPMEGFDSSRARKLLKLKSGDEICMILAVGKRAPNGVFGPRVRFDREQFITRI
jgi:nitroreductase